MLKQAFSLHVRNKGVQWLLAAGLSLCIGLSSPSLADHTISPEAIPTPVQTAIKTLDPEVTFREDGLVKFPDGTEYVLVSPEVMVDSDSVTVIKRVPEQPKTPDLIELSDGHFLLRIVSLSTGRKTFPILDEVPLSLRSGLLPQNFTFPDGFLFPSQWKSLSGNLLTPESAEQKDEPVKPLAILSEDKRMLTLWDPGKGDRLHQADLPCDASEMAVSPDGKQLTLACETEMRLLTFDVETHQLQSHELTSLPGMMVVDDANRRVYIAHPAEPKVTVFDLKNKRIAKSIGLAQPAHLLTISPFRNQLITAATQMDVLAEYEKKRHEERIQNETVEQRNRRKSKGQPELKLEPAQPLVQTIDLKSLRVERRIPVMPNLTAMYIQDEKYLWMVSASEKMLQKFDLRWLEYSDKIPLAEVPASMASDDTWLYLLFPQSNTLQRMDLKTMAFGTPITMEPNAFAGTAIVDNDDHLAYVLSMGNTGLQIVNLNRAEWVGTQKTEFPSSGKMTWVAPQEISAEQRVRIKFQDGRLMLQSAR